MTVERAVREAVRAWGARLWARWLLCRGTAVIVDTETADLYGDVVQVSVIDLTGAVLLDELVRPAGRIAPEASAVHGITDEQVSSAPTLADLAPQLLAVTRGRKILAYNAPYDREVLVAGLTAAQVDPCQLADPHRWGCLMRARAAAERRGWSPLDGPHDARGDCYAALQILGRIAGRRSTACVRTPSTRKADQ